MFGGDHEDAGDSSFQSYAVDLRLPAAGSLLQRQAGVAEGSGWMMPTTETEFVASLEDVVRDTIAATGAPPEARIVVLDEVDPRPSDVWEQCGEPTGRYVQEMMFSHDCTVDCSGDTIATTYVFEVTSDDGVIRGGAIPAFQPDGKDAYAFGQGTHRWTDVDPFDDDPDRSTRDGTPPH